MIQQKTIVDQPEPLSRDEVGSLASIIMVMQRRFMSSLMGELARGKVSFPSFSCLAISAPKGRPA